MSQPSQESNSAPQPWQNANLPVFFIRAWATSIYVFIRGGFGSRFLGFQAAAVLLLAPLYASLKRVTDLDTMCFYLCMYLLLCVLHKQISRRRQRLNIPCHSYYDGIAGLRCFFRWLKCSEVTFKRFVEPVVVIALGIGMVPSDEPFGMYIVTGGLCMAFLANAYTVQDQARLDDLNDSILDQQALAERLRESRGDRF